MSPNHIMSSTSPSALKGSSGPYYDRRRETRVSKPKVGAVASLANRERRVKCDENRPECHRCCKFGRRCVGYGIDKAQGELEPRPERRVLLLKTAATLSSVMRESSQSHFETEKDFQYFQHFLIETSQELSGVFKLPIWSSTPRRSNAGKHPSTRSSSPTRPPPSTASPCLSSRSIQTS
ncbi:hypothetical protein BDZ45DRAFT_305111 [Acephala macrosclerotiorum]|nr:hypothetical protein BDZ45DRAFT_305111 [Acephala macrosclerotiorum]